MPDCTYQEDAFTEPCGRPAPWVHDWRTMWDPDDAKPSLLCDLHAHEYAAAGLSVTRPGEKRFRPMPIEDDDVSEVSYIRGAAPGRKPGQAERALAVVLVVMLAAIALAAAVLVFVAIVRLITKVAGW